MATIKLPQFKLTLKPTGLSVIWVTIRGAELCFRPAFYRTDGCHGGDQRSVAPYTRHDPHRHQSSHVARSPRTLPFPLGFVSYENARQREGRALCVAGSEGGLNIFRALRGPGESYSDVIIELAATE